MKCQWVSTRVYSKREGRSYCRNCSHCRTEMRTKIVYVAIVVLSIWNEQSMRTSRRHSARRRAGSQEASSTLRRYCVGTYDKDMKPPTKKKHTTSTPRKKHTSRKKGARWRAPTMRVWFVVRTNVQLTLWGNVKGMSSAEPFGDAS